LFTINSNFLEDDYSSGEIAARCKPYTHPKIS